MRTVASIILTLVLAATIGCEHHTDDKTVPFPWWILELQVLDINGRHAVTGCPQVTYEVRPDGTSGAIGCYEGSNDAFPYGHLSGSVTVWYSVSCPGYYDSGQTSASFNEANATYNSARHGAIQIVTANVYLSRRP